MRATGALAGAEPGVGVPASESGWEEGVRLACLGC